MSPGLAERIDAVLASQPERVVLEDAKGQVSAAELRGAIVASRPSVEAAAPAGGCVVVDLPHGAAQVTRMLSVIASGRVPVVVSERRGSREAAGHVCPSGTALALYTSGSSGVSKCVFVPEEGLLHVADELIERLDLGRDTVAGVAAPLYHSMALNTQLLPTLLAGGRCVLIERGLAISHLYRNIVACGCDYLALVSDMLYLLDEERRHRDLPPADGPRLLVLAGAVIRPKLLRLARELFPGARLHKCYGLTEAIRNAMVDDRDPRFFDWDSGYPLPGHSLEIRDEAGRLLPAGASGRIFVRAPSLLLGYLHGPATLCDRGYLDTGDLGWLEADGRLTVEGRAGRGREALRLERLARELDGVREAFCLRLEGGRHVLFVEADTGSPPLLDRLPCEVAILHRLPRTSSSKVEAAALRARLEEKRA